MKLFGFIASLLGSNSQAGIPATGTSGASQPMLYEATATETNARAAAVLPTEGSEDARKVLGSITFSESAKHDPAEPRDYLPEEVTEWVVGVSFTPAVRISRDQIRNQLSTAWRKQNGNPTIFGRESSTGRWTYTLTGDVSGPFTELKFTWAYFTSWSDEKTPGLDDFERWAKAAVEASSNFGEATIAIGRTPKEAAQHALRLSALHERFGRDLLIVLQVPEGARLDGRKIWDVMLSLGLRWGDMDLFHWENSSGWGDDHFFSVWTSTEPGYFLPERIAAGETKVANLVFGFSVPRCAKPVEVAEAMVRSASYCQTRLGGELLDQNGKAFQPERFLQEIRATIAGFKQAGFEPGTSAAMHLF